MASSPPTDGRPPHGEDSSRQRGSRSSSSTTSQGEKAPARRRTPPLIVEAEGPRPEPEHSESRHGLGERSRKGNSTLESNRQNEIYEEAKRADYEIPKLQAMPIAELVELAKGAGVASTKGLSRQELIFQVLKLKVTSQGLGWGEGTLDILPDGFGFLRSQRYNYRAGPDDIYVSPSQIRRLALRQGHQIAGPVRPPKDGEKYFALLHVEAVNGLPPDRLGPGIPFDDLTPLLPDRLMHLEHPDCGLDMRILDLLAPMGFGQRTLVLSPPHSGRTRLLANIARAILHNHPDVYVILSMLDERPEEVTEIVRTTGPDARREVIASTFDEPATQHITLAEMAMEKARRMVEAGRDVVILLDSLTQLTRAYNTEVPHSGKIVTAGLDTAALAMPKKLFGAARRIEEGGSLTVVATVLTDTDSAVDAAIAEEFKGKSNAEIVLDAALASLHVYPPIDVRRSGTRREDNLLTGEAVEALRALRRRLLDKDADAALETLLAELPKSADNAAYLASLR